MYEHWSGSVLERPVLCLVKMSEFFWLDIGRTPFSKHPEEVRQLKTSSMVAWKNAQLISLCVRRAHILVEADQLLSRYFARQKTLRFNAYYSYNTKIGFHTSTTQAFKPVPVLIRSGNSVCHGSISIENYLNKNIPPSPESDPQLPAQEIHTQPQAQETQAKN